MLLLFLPLMYSLFFMQCAVGMHQQAHTPSAPPIVESLSFVFVDNIEIIKKKKIEEYRILNYPATFLGHIDHISHFAKVPLNIHGNRISLFVGLDSKGIIQSYLNSDKQTKRVLIKIDTVVTPDQENSLRCDADNFYRISHDALQNSISKRFKTQNTEAPKTNSFKITPGSYGKAINPWPAFWIVIAGIVTMYCSNNTCTALSIGVISFLSASALYCG